MNIKHNQPFETKTQHFTNRSEEMVKELSEQLYFFIPKILSNLESDRDQMRNLTEFFGNNYQSYLGTYYSIREVEMYNSKQSHVEELIENERQSLNTHLKYLQPHLGRTTG